MRNTIFYIDEAKKKLGIESDYGLAKELGLSRAAVSLWRNGKGSMDDYAATRIAEIIGVNPMIVIAAVNVEKEKTEERKEYWKNFYERLGGIAATILVAFVTLIVTLGHPSPLQAAPLLDTHSAFADDIHYAK